MAIGAGAMLVAAIGGAVALWLWLPGLIAERTLGLLDLICEPVSITLTPDLSHASIARTECTVPIGPIASFALSNGAEVSLTDLHPRTIDVPLLAVNPRALELAGTATAVLVTGDTPDPIRRVMSALAALAARTDLPTRVTVGEIDFGRGAYVIETHGLVMTHGPGTFDVALPTLGPPPYHGTAIDWAIAVNELAVHATPGSAIVTGRFDVRASVFSFPITRSIGFRVTGSGLDGSAPDYDLWIEPSAEVVWLQAHGQALLDEIRAAGGLSQAVEQRRDVRIEQRTERVHALRERLDQQVERAQE